MIKATVAEENLELNDLTISIDMPAKHAFMKKIALTYENFPCPKGGEVRDTKTLNL